MSRSKDAGGRRLRAAFVTAVAAFAVSAVGASAAQAATITLDHGFLKIAGNEDPFEVITPANVVTLTTGGAFPGAFTVADNSDVNEVQTIGQTAGTTTGGTYTITVDTGTGPADTTDAIPFNAPLRDTNDPNTGAIDDISEALNRLDNLTYFDVKLSGGPLPGTPVTLEFVGAGLYGENIPEVTVDSTFLTPGGSAYGPGTTTQGGGKADFDFPQFEGDLGGFPLAVDVAPIAPLAGTYDGGTGAMNVGSATYVANVAVGPPLNADCNYTVNLAFSTSDNTVFRGDLFDAASNPPTNGAITDDWTTLPGSGGPCSTLDGFTAGPGALWLSNGVAAPTLVPKATTTPPAATPAPKKCKKGQKLKKGKCVKKKKKKKKKK